MKQTLTHNIARPLTYAALFTLAIAAVTSASWAADDAPAPTKPFPVAVVETLNTLAGGPHAGYRANHAKGVLVSGEFTPALSAKGLSKAVHFAKRVAVLVRFSNGTGVPNLRDADSKGSPHGIAIRFQLPGGANTDIVSISENSFPVATPE